MTRIGSGKTTLCRMLEERGVPVFYCDQEAKRIMAADVQLQAEIAALISLPEPSSVPSLPEPPASFKAALRAYISQGPEYADRINRLVWPRVAAAWEQFCCAHAAQQPSTEGIVMQPLAGSIVMECALLFESGFDRLVDTTILITAPAALRQQRVAQRDGITPQQVSAIIALQLSDDAKAQRATHVLSNDGTPADLLDRYIALPTLV